MELPKCLMEVPGVYDVDVAFDGFAGEGTQGALRIRAYCTFPVNKEEGKKQRQNLADVTERIQCETGHGIELTVCYVRPDEVEHGIAVWKL